MDSFPEESIVNWFAIRSVAQPPVTSVQRARARGRYVSSQLHIIEPSIQSESAWEVLKDRPMRDRMINAQVCNRSPGGN